VELSTFGPQHLDDAAHLVAERVRVLRGAIPLLAPSLETPDAWRPRLADLLAAGPEPVDPEAGAVTDDAIDPGVVATDGGRMLGFLLAAVRPAAGRAYCPDYANAVLPGGRRVLEALYAHAAARWHGAGIHSHIVGSFEGSPDERQVWSWLGFGRLVVDAVRPLEPLEPSARGATSGPARPVIRPAGPTDVEAVIDLEDGLRRHLLASPVFLTLPPPRDREGHLERLADPASVTFLAEVDGEVIADLRIGPHADDVTPLLQDDGTAAITAAFTRPEHRGSGVATALLDAALAWALDRGYQRCGVDFESANLEAIRFWPGHFQPVSVAYVRRLHPRSGQVVG
jgi:GNAT superfamily N-acetyltransferase